MALLIGFFEILLALIFLVLLRCLSKKSVIPGNWPLVGMLPGFLLHINCLHDWAAEILALTQCTFLFKCLWFTGMDMLLTIDPANIHYILSANFPNFPKGSEFQKVFEVFGNGLLNSDFDMWRMQRKVAQLFLTHKRFLQFVMRTTRDKCQNGVLKLFDEVSDRGLVVDLQDLFQRLTFDSTCKLVTGFDPCCLSIEFPEVVFCKAIDDAAKAIFYRHIYPEWFWKLQKRLGVGMEGKLTKAWENLDKCIEYYLDLKRKELRDGRDDLKGDERGADLLTSYMMEKEALGALKCNDKFLRDTILNFMIAGRGTIASALTWFFWAISKNPSVEMKIREEIRSVIPGEELKRRVFDIEKYMHSMVYLHGALCESLRFYPPVPFEHKRPIKSDVLPSGHQIDPKTKILIHLYSMGRMKTIWGDDCMEFRPERWISETGQIRHEPSYKFLPFNAGPRTCLGKAVAFIQMKTIVSAILYNYEVQVLEGQDAEPSRSLLLNMKHGLKVKLARRVA